MSRREELQAHLRAIEANVAEAYRLIDAQDAAFDEDLRVRLIPADDDAIQHVLAELALIRADRAEFRRQNNWREAQIRGLTEENETLRTDLKKVTHERGQYEGELKRLVGAIDIMVEVVEVAKLAWARKK